MFGFFRKKNKSQEAEVITCIAASREEALNALVLSIKENPSAHVFYYFPASKNEFIKLLISHGIEYREETGYITNSISVHLHDANKFVATTTVTDHIFYCIDIYPLQSVFAGLRQKLSLISPKAELHAYAGLDEPLLRMFGSERILSLMKTMGMKEGELITHSMISGSIEKAQKKLEEKVMTPLPANSAEEWFSKNISNNS